MENSLKGSVKVFIKAEKTLFKNLIDKILVIILKKYWIPLKNLKRVLKMKLFIRNLKKCDFHIFIIIINKVLFNLKRLDLINKKVDMIFSTVIYLKYISYISCRLRKF